MGKLLICMVFMMMGQGLFAQTDTLPPAGTDTVVRTTIPAPARIRKTAPLADSLQQDSVFSATNINLPPLADSVWMTPGYSWAQHPYFRFTNPTRLPVSIRQWQGKEAIFYALIALLLFFAVIKNSFYRYLQDLINVFFRNTMRVKQIKDQLLQSPLPSLFFNIFFLLSLGFFLALVLQRFQLTGDLNFWLLFLYCTAGLLVIYAIKYLVLKFLGWIFQVSDAIDTYIFIVFATNKVIGLVLLPFIVLLAFSYGMVNQASLNLGITLVLSLFAYRYFLSYISVHRQVRISFFHFLIYLVAFEIAPLLLINKLLFRFLSESS